MAKGKKVEKDFIDFILDAQQDYQLLKEFVCLRNRDEFKAYFDIEVMFPGEVQGHFQTVGGYVMTRLDRVPSEADSFQDDHFHYEVVDMDNLRVDKILVRPLRLGQRSEQ